MTKLANLRWLNVSEQLLRLLRDSKQSNKSNWNNQKSAEMHRVPAAAAKNTKSAAVPADETIETVRKKQVTVF